MKAILKVRGKKAMEVLKGNFLMGELNYLEGKIYLGEDTKRE